MRIRVVCQRGDDILVNRAMLSDPRLSFRAKGVLVSLLARIGDVGPDDGNAIVLDRADRREMELGLRELHEAGYVVHEAASDDSGEQMMVYEISRLPLLDEPDEREAKAFDPSSPQRSLFDPPQDVDPRTPAERIIDRLNELRRESWEWAKYTRLQAKHAKNVEHIHGRMKEGYAESDLILVLEYIAAIDGGKEESRKYFDCVTPFNTKNFERNLAMARDWEARGRRLPGERGSDGVSRDASYYEKWGATHD